MTSVLDSGATTARRRPAGRPGVPQAHGHGRGGLIMSKSQYSSGASPDAGGSGVLRLMADPRTPVFVTVHTGGRRRYGYWQPYDARTGRGGCYVALPTAVCDRLYDTGRITLGEPLVDPTKTTYRVRPARTPASPARARVAPVRIPEAPVRASAQRLAA